VQDAPDDEGQTDEDDGDGLLDRFDYRDVCVILLDRGTRWEGRDTYR